MKAVSRPRITGGRFLSWVLALPSLIFLATLFLLGFFSLVTTSLSIGRPEGPFAIYESLFASPAFWDAFFRTTRLSILTVALSLLVAYPIAYAIARSKGRTRQWLLLAVIIPWMSSVVVRSFGWQIILGDRGPINEVLESLGIISHPLALVGSEFGIVVGLIHVLSPFMILTLVSVLVSIDLRIEEAAALLGASPGRIFTRIVWPMSRRGVATGCVLVFLMANAVVVTPLMLGGARSQTIATMMYAQLLQLYNFERGAALAVVLVVLVVPPTLLISWWGQRSQFKRGG
jgi:putative spermidine/putrescine transport system permease protein